MRKIALLLKNGKKSSFFDKFKTRSTKFRFLRVPKTIFGGEQNLWGSSTLQKLNFGYKIRYLSPKDKVSTLHLSQLTQRSQD